MNTFREDVERAVAYHGHLCSGQCIGVKMARLALNKLGIDIDNDPKRICVFVECDRCPADAIGVVTGTRVGKRTYKALDIGKVAATFVDLKTNDAVRIQRKKRCHPAQGEDMIDYYENLPDDEIFKVQRVEVDIRPCDLPGPPIEVQYCEICGEDITDSRHVEKDGRILCRTCAGESYYRVLEDEK